MAKALNKDRLLTQLNSSRTTADDQNLYQVIKQLIGRLEELEKLVGSSVTNNTGSVTNQIIQQFLIGGGDGSSSEDLMVVPGPVGPTGATGATGPAGPVTLGPMGIEPDSPEEPLMVPGPIGATGATGATGPTGPPFPAFIIMDGNDGEDGIPIPGRDGSAGSGTGEWELIEARPCSATADEDFINLSVYSEIVVIADAVTKATIGVLSCRVSTDNGGSFLSASGDYASIAGAGTRTNVTRMDMHNTTSTAARTCYIRIINFNVGASPKWANNSSGTPEYIISGLTALNAIRIFGSGGGNLNGGTLYVFGRR